MSRPGNKPRRQLRTTILLVVEGFTEEAFTKHLKLCYINREMHISLTIKNAKGHGPDGIVDTFKSTFKTTSYFDLKGAVLDSDLPITQENSRFFDENTIHTFISDPCIEATLLELSGRKSAPNTKACKTLLLRFLAGNQLESNFYEKHFTKEIIDSRRKNLALVDGLLSFMTNGR